MRYRPRPHPPCPKSRVHRSHQMREAGCSRQQIPSIEPLTMRRLRGPAPGIARRSDRPTWLARTPGKGRAALAAIGTVVLMWLSAALLVQSYRNRPPGEANSREADTRHPETSGPSATGRSTRAFEWLTAATFATGHRWLQDPVIALREAGDCMVGVSPVTACEAALLHALRSNPRQTHAALWLAQLAEFQHKPHHARCWYAYAMRKDRGFQPLWAWWNSPLSQEPWSTSAQVCDAVTGLDTLAELPTDAPALRRQVLMTAPPDFQGHFPPLLARGWSASEIVEELARRGQHRRLLTFAQYLAESSHLQSGHWESMAALAMIVKGELPGSQPAGDSGDPHPRVPCAALVRTAVTTATRRQTHLVDAANLWVALLREMSPVCTPLQSAGLEDKRDTSDDHPLWNFNPALRRPLIPESFDWSVIRHPAVSVEPLLASAGGLTFTIAPASTARFTLLARTLPLTNGAIAIETVSVWKPSLSPGCPDAVHWELRDLTGRVRFDRATIALPTADTTPAPAYPASTPTASTRTLSHLLRASPPPSPGATAQDAVQLLLVYQPPSGLTCPAHQVSIQSVRLNPVEFDFGGL